MRPGEGGVDFLRGLSGDAETDVLADGLIAAMLTSFHRIGRCACRFDSNRYRRCALCETATDPIKLLLQMEFVNGISARTRSSNRHRRHGCVTPRSRADCF